MSFIFNTIATLSTIFTITIICCSFEYFCVATGREHRDNSEDLNDFDIALVRRMIILTIIVALYLLALLMMSCFTTISFSKYFIRFLLVIIEIFLFIYISTHGTRDDEMAALAIKIAVLLIVVCTSIVLISSIQLTAIDFLISIVFAIIATLVNPTILLPILPSIFMLLVFDIPDSIRKKVKDIKRR